MKRQIIWSNYCNDMFTQEAMEDTKEYLLEENEEVTEEDIENQIYAQNDLDFEVISDYIKYQFNNKGKLLAVGTVGRWNGTFEGGKIIDTFRDLLDLFEDCDYIKFEDENGHFYVTGSHHDGSISVEVKELTQKGEDYADRHEYDMSDRNLHKKLWNSSNYSRLFRYDW